MSDMLYHGFSTVWVRLCHATLKHLRWLILFEPLACTALLAQWQVRLRNVSRKSARFRISNSRTSDNTAATATAITTATATAASGGSGVRAVYKPRGPVPAGLTCDVAVELTPGQYEVSTSTIISENNFVMFHCLLHSIVLIHTAVQ
jgi:hypothetical protein